MQAAITMPQRGHKNNRIRLQNVFQVIEIRDILPPVVLLSIIPEGHGTLRPRLSEFQGARSPILLVNTHFFMFK